MIAHELLADVAPRYGIFHPDNPLAALPLEKRIAEYAEAGSSADPVAAGEKMFAPGRRPRAGLKG